MNIIGHQKILNLLDRSLKRDSISQAYLFAGPESVGKFTIAQEFAKSAINGTDFISSVSRKRDEKSRPLLDLIIVEPEKEEKRGITKEKEIKIEQIRKARKNLLLFPFQRKYKVLIVDNAHRMNEASQNALLKILEEPNSTSVIILVTHDESRILPTLKSRCQKILFSLVSEEKIKKGLEKKGMLVSNELISLSLGRPGIALTISDKREEFLLRQEALEQLQGLPAQSLNQRLEMAEELSKNIVKTAKKLELWIWITRLQGLKEFQRKEQSGQKNFSRAELIEKSLSVLQQTNANSRLVLENLLINL
ncbi:MAG: AAA family ATPase [Candidatus Moranbacteria bacterium]|nr:AAA family ATPase [Candidatus Moranbacteria bacterium]